MTDLILTEDDYRQLVQSQDGKATTDSLKVAEKFGKQHSKVLRAIRQLACSPKFRQANFGESSYLNEQGKKQPVVTMTKDGFMFLVMGFTGAKAGAWKEAFIEAFNRMADQIACCALSYEQRRNYLTLVYQQKKGLANFAGKAMRNWQLEKPLIEGEMLAIERSGQGVLQLH